MKKLILPLAIVIVFLSQSFIRMKPTDEIKGYELKQNDSIPFKHGPNKKPEEFYGSLGRGSYDKTSYNIIVDKKGNLSVTNIMGSKGKHQNELEFMLCSGVFSRNEDTIIIHAKTVYNKFYLISIKNIGKIDSFSKEVHIELISKTLRNQYCPSLVTTSRQVSLVALPQNVKYDEIWKPIHTSETIGIFTYLKVTDSNGKSKICSSGDYVLIGGNSLN